MDRQHRPDRPGTAAHGTRWMAGSLCAVLAGAVILGCSQPPAVDPWRDDSIPRSAYGTASSELVLASGEAPAIRVREIPPTAAPVARADVPHYPLWWEDPFEDQGDNDDRFAWTWQDYLHMPYGLGRFILNTVGTPASAVVTPPWVSMVSDGVVDDVHDARRGVSPKPTAGPSDFIGMESRDAAAEPAP